MNTAQVSTLVPNFDEDGLVPVIVQDRNTHQVLMLAYANFEAYAATLKTGYAYFYSRSRKRLWKKGEKSGNTMRMDDVRLDCDGDALLYIVIPSGPACHTGKQTCFWRSAVGYILESAWGKLKVTLLKVCKAIAKI